MENVIMAFSEDDKKEIAKLISKEVARQLVEARITPGIFMDSRLIEGDGGP